jgi:hypothetical protein
MRLFHPLAAGLVAALLCLTTQAAAQDYSGGLPELSAQVQLVTAQNAMNQLAVEADPTRRRQNYSLAITSLTALYQLHGCEWALALLELIYAAEDCPQMYYGFSLDGRIALRVEELVLFNPIYEGRAVFLCQLESNSALTFSGSGEQRLQFVLADGSVMQPEELSAEHVLCEQLDSLAHTFLPPASLASGAATAFKQLYVLPEKSAGAVSTVRFNWSEYSFELPVPRGIRNR